MTTTTRLATNLHIYIYDGPLPAGYTRGAHVSGPGWSGYYVTRERDGLTVVGRERPDLDAMTAAELDDQIRRAREREDERQAEEGTRMATTYYSVQMIDSETSASWMGLPSTISARPGSQDSGRVRYTVETTDADALEAALEADSAVLEYETLS